MFSFPLRHMLLNEHWDTKFVQGKNYKTVKSHIWEGVWCKKPVHNNCNLLYIHHDSHIRSLLHVPIVHKFIYYSINDQLGKAIERENAIIRKQFILKILFQINWWLQRVLLHLSQLRCKILSSGSHTHIFLFFSLSKWQITSWSSH